MKIKHSFLHVFLHKKCNFNLIFGLIGIIIIPFHTYAQKLSDELIQQRLNALKPQIELLYKPEVKKFIEEFLSDPEKLREISAGSKHFFPMIERCLRSKGISTDLKYLAAVASGLKPENVASSGASGMWTITYSVAKMYKLKINTYIDERRDPHISSIAAATHLRDLYSIYKSWPLAIAAYGCSPVMLNKCIRMAGNSLYFWDIYPYMPSGCRDLYPRFIAQIYVLNYQKEHGIKSLPQNTLPESDSVLVNKWLSFQQISSVMDIPIEMIRRMNPIFRKDVIPYNENGYSIRLPKSKMPLFIGLKDSVYKPITAAEFYPIEIQKSPSSIDNNSDSIRTNKSEKKENKFDKKRVYYVVKKGDKLQDIADLFDVSTFEIKSWNHLRNTNLKKGKRLIIWVNSHKSGYYNRMNKMSLKQKKRLRQRD